MTAQTVEPLNGRTSAPCTAPAYSAFDFWVGDWIVTDTKTGAVVAFDRIVKVNGGCALLQDVAQLNDDYRDPASPHRLQGRSLTGFDGALWRQTYSDNMGSFITVAGGPDAGGVITMLGDLRPARNLQLKVVWEPRADGTIRNYGLQKKPDGEWRPLFDVTYRPNKPAS